jgi:hypothetical protein
MLCAVPLSSSMSNTRTSNLFASIVIFSKSVDDLCEQSLKQAGNASLNINDWALE